jgi:hypothetical protein
MNDNLLRALEQVAELAERGAASNSLVAATLRKAHEVLSTPADREPVSVPEGWQLVPKEPTQEMFLSAEKAGVSFVSQQKCWGAMLAAAPTKES